MNQDIKQRWVDALRSGEYEQGRGCLHDSNGSSFCCLGVLTDLYIKEHDKEWHREPGCCTQLTFERHCVTLSPSVVTWAGLSNRNPCVGGDGIAGHNDDGMPFDELAQLIEEYL
jgi:hypothetical protein